MGLDYGKARFERAYGTAEQLPGPSKPEVSFVGRSNVGKSSLINRLFNRKNLAKTSSTPGKTATINFYEADGVHFVDLPGYGYAKTGRSEKARWADLIMAYYTQERSYNLVVCLVDIRHDAQKLDLQMLAFLRECGFEHRVVLTKADKLSKNKQNAQLATLARQLAVPREELIVTSAQTGAGIDALKRRIEDTCC